MIKVNKTSYRSILYVDMKDKGRCLLLTLYFFSGMLYMWIMWTANDVHMISVMSQLLLLNYYMFISKS